MIDLHWLYILAGAMFAAFALSSAGDRTNPKRWGNAAFWGLIALSFWFGDLFGDLGNGVLVLALVRARRPASPRQGLAAINEHGRTRATFRHVR